MEPERRQFDRYLFNNKDFYLSTDKSLSVYKIKDISQGGLSFQYYPNRDEELADGYINIKIIKGEKVESEQKSCFIVYDIRTLSEGQSFSGKKSRQCGIRFPKISPLKKSWVCNT